MIIIVKKKLRLLISTSLFHLIVIETACQENISWVLPFDKFLMSDRFSTNDIRLYCPGLNWLYHLEGRSFSVNTIYLFYQTYKSVWKVFGPWTTTISVDVERCWFFTLIALVKNYNTIDLHRCDIVDLLEEVIFKSILLEMGRGCENDI